MNATKSLTVPTVHLNGTGETGLVEPLRAAYAAIRDALGALNEAAPHGRDYYLTTGAYERARDEHLDRVRRLESVGDELIALAREIQKQRAV
jgi:hypothetical protein